VILTKGLQQGGNADVVGVYQECERQKEEVIVEDGRLSLGLISVGFTLLVEVHEESMYFFFVDVHEKHEEECCPYTKFYGLYSHLLINGVLILFNEEADLGKRALLDANVDHEQDLVDVNVVNVTDQLFSL
jgi:hypothetical protein